MNNKRRVKITELGKVVPGGELVPFSQPDPNFNREKELAEFHKRKAKEGSRMLSIPTAQDLYFVREEKKRNREDIYEKILQNIIMDVREANEDEKIDCQYRVPQAMAHRPTYNFTECVWYVVRRLRKEGGMVVRFYQPDLVYVNWRVKIVDTSKDRKKEPKKTDKKGTTTRTRGKGKKKEEIKVGTFELDSDDDMLDILAGLKKR